jgi:hypothetical protein
MEWCRRIGRWVLPVFSCGVLMAAGRYASADGPDGNTQRADLLIAQASAMLSHVEPIGLGLRDYVPPGRSLTSLLNEIKVLNDRVGPLALSNVGPFLSRPTGLIAEWRTEHFNLHYATDGPDRPSGGPGTDFLAIAAEACERAWVAHHRGPGWPSPILDSNSDGRIDVYIRDLGWGAYGYTLHETASEGTGESGFISIDNDFAGHPTLGTWDALRVTLAHEYDHVVQFAFGYAPEADWFMEQSATMMEGQVCPQIPDRFRHLPFFVSSPHRHLDLSNGSYEYGAWLWPQFLLEHEGWGVPLLVSAWRAWSGSSRTMVAALDLALRERGSSLAAAFGEWAIWNAFLGQTDDGTHYARLNEYPCAIWPEISVNRYPVDGLTPAPTHQPEHLGASYIAFAPDPGSPNTRLEVKLSSGNGAIAATLVSWPQGGGAPTTQTVSLAGGTGTFQVLGWNEIERACLVIAVGPEAPSACAYSLTAHTRLSSADVGPDTISWDGLRLSLAPNPSEARTTITYELPADGPALLRLYDAAGRLVETLMDGRETAGVHQVEWRGPRDRTDSMDSGVYFCEIRTPNESRRVRLIRTR